jgi:hypothetical protein
MRHNRYYPSRQSDQLGWLANFSNKLPGYASALGLSSGQVTAAVADCGWLHYFLLSWLPDLRAFQKAATSAHVEAQFGTGTATQIIPTFSPPTPHAGVVAVVPGALNGVFALLKAIKNGDRCAESIAIDLGIAGTDASPRDLSLVQPVISAKVSGSAVDIKWNWQGLRNWLGSCQIMVDRGDGKGFELLCVDTTPNYIDTQPFPDAKTVWTYKAIYRAGDAQVGQWSQTVSVSVGV